MVLTFVLSQCFIVKLLTKRKIRTKIQYSMKKDTDLIKIQLVITKGQQMRAEIFLPIWWIKDSGAYRERSVILFVHEHTLQVLLVLSSILTVTIEWFYKMCETVTPERDTTPIVCFP